MDVKELRIGNYVYVDNNEHHKHIKNIPMKVVSINETESVKRGIWTNSVGVEHISKLEGMENHSFEELYESNRNYNQFIFFIKPIPLTQEWLLKFGFEIKKLESYRGEYYMSSISGMVYYFFTDSNEIEKQGSSYTCKHVHQLQNLYFALTQKELTYDF